MKILLFGLVLLVAWKAGFVLLAALLIGALWLTGDGIHNLHQGVARGASNTVEGALAVGATLLTAFLKFALLYLTWSSLTTVFPGIVPWFKAVLAWVGSF